MNFDRAKAELDYLKKKTCGFDYPEAIRLSIERKQELTRIYWETRMEPFIDQGRREYELVKVERELATARINTGELLLRHSADIHHAIEMSNLEHKVRMNVLLAETDIYCKACDQETE